MRQGDEPGLLYAHCKKCLAEVPENVSMKQWARLEIAIDVHGAVYVTCTRHDLGVFKTGPGAYRGKHSCAECEDTS
jgi:hypothetical protein